MKTLLILGAGTAGTMMANRMAEVLPASDWQITVVDRDDLHVYQPGLLFVPFGLSRPEEIARPRRDSLAARVRFEVAAIQRVDPEAKTVFLCGDRELTYDILIIATGTEIQPEATPGLMDVGWYESAFDFYTLEGAAALHTALCDFTQGRIVVNVVDMPIKCPVAPLEFLFLADAFFTERGVRQSVELVYATPLEGAFTKPVASARLGGLLESKGITVHPDFHTSAVDGAARRLHSFEGTALDYDLLVTVPLHGGAPFLEASGLGDGSGFVPTHKNTLQALEHDDVFVIGDATNVPTSKAGSVAHFQAEVLADNVLRFIQHRELLPAFDGHANCFIETGYGKAMLIDFNYDTEPLAGRFPLPGIGPFSLLEESAVNHWGKLAFRWIYWNVLLPGNDLPMEHRMSMVGKTPASEATRA